MSHYLFTSTWLEIIPYIVKKYDVLLTVQALTGIKNKKFLPPFHFDFIGISLKLNKFGN